MIKEYNMLAASAIALIRHANARGLFDSSMTFKANAQRIIDEEARLFGNQPPISELEDGPIFDDRGGDNVFGITKGGKR